MINSLPSNYSHKGYLQQKSDSLAILVGLDELMGTSPIAGSQSRQRLDLRRGDKGY